MIARVCSYVGCKLKLMRWLSMRLISSYHESESSFDVYPPKLFITSSEADPPGWSEPQKISLRYKKYHLRNHDKLASYLVKRKFRRYLYKTYLACLFVRFENLRNSTFEGTYIQYVPSELLSFVTKFIIIIRTVK